MKSNYFNLWKQYRAGITTTMERIIIDDIEAGYNPEGEVIKKEIQQLKEYDFETITMLKLLHTLDDNEVELYCYIDLLKRGEVERRVK